VAGGWQGLDLISRREEEESTPERPDLSGKSRQDSRTQEKKEEKKGKADAGLSRCAARYPRTYHVTFRIVLPLFFLIGLAFFCGYFLALFESDAEKDGNDALLAGVVDEAVKIGRLVELATTAPSECLQAYYREGGDNSTTNETAKLTKFMADCGGTISSELSGLVEEFRAKLTLEAYSSLTFDWISCRDGLKRNADRGEQAQQVIDRWIERYNASLATYRAEGLTEDEARERALAEASGHDSCEVNAAAGALFWFTSKSGVLSRRTFPQKCSDPHFSISRHSSFFVASSSSHEHDRIRQHGSRHDGRSCPRVHAGLC
jgi:hypothetical protein